MQAGNNNLHMLIFDYNQTSTGGAGTKSFIWATITNQSLGGMLHQHFLWIIIKLFGKHDFVVQRRMYAFHYFIRFLVFFMKQWKILMADSTCNTLHSWKYGMDLYILFTSNISCLEMSLVMLKEVCL